MSDSHEGSSRDRQGIMRERGRHDAVAATQAIRGTMWLALLLYQLGTLALTQAQNACMGRPTFRRPVDTDIDVTCGSQRIELQILLCPIYFNGYNESLVALNSVHSKKECKGVADWTVDPPVIKFNFSITEEAVAACSNTMTVSQEAGSGAFSDFSNVQFVNISGMVCTNDPTQGTITYHQESMYLFSCKYPLQYLVQNTSMAVSGTSVTVKDGNGSFISTLSMQLYTDRAYTTSLRIPPGGLQLKTRIYVEVKASNLTTDFNVLLDRCFATMVPFPISSTFYDLFVGCNRDGQTMIVVNGLQQEARFSFEAFRFVQHNTTVATFFLHCATRLCKPSFCSTLVQNCTTSNNLRRRRGVTNSQATPVSEVATISSGPIIIHTDNRDLVESEGSRQSHMGGTLLAVAIVAGVIGAFCIILVALIAYQKYNPDLDFGMRILHSPK